jgi:hypothetical protein
MFVPARAPEGLPGGSEGLDEGHIDWRREEQAVRGECLKEPKMRKAVATEIGRDQILERPPDAQEVGKLIDAVILADEHAS